MIRDLRGQQFGNYHLIHRLGGGGFADVYLGQHVRISSQQAAIKILHLADVDERLFQQEAERMAMLRHPQIIRLYDFDIQQGIPFLVMEYAPHGSLANKHSGQRLEIDVIIHYVEQIASALQFAHDHNIIHRDIKPDNILIDSQDELKVSDFGIAVVSKTGRSSLESSYNIGGTPYYMAPEMFRGKTEKASDQYSLGIMAYEWLCGKLPYTEGDFIQIGFQHNYEQIPSIRESIPTISPSIEHTVLQALTKDPKSRFASVKMFADALTNNTPEISNYGNGASILLPSTRSTYVSAAPLTKQSSRVPIGTTLVTYKEHGNAWSTLAWSPDSKFIATGNFAGDVQLWDTVSWKLISTIYECIGTVNAVIWSPDGRKLAFSSEDKTVQVWDARTWKCLFVSNFNVTGMSWSPDGRHLAFYTDMSKSTVQILDATSFKQQNFYKGHSEWVTAVAWSPDGRKVASSSHDKTVQIWDSRKGKHLFSYKGHNQRVNTVAWSPDGSRLASGSTDKTAQVWDARTGHILLCYSGHTDAVNTLAWSPDGSKLASGGYLDDGTLQVWDSRTGNCFFSYNTGGFGGVTNIKWSPDGNKISSNFWNNTEILDVYTGQSYFSRIGHADNVKAMVWSPDGTRIATCSEYRDKVQVWNALTGQYLYSYTGHSENVNAVTWSPDGNKLASCSDDNTVQVWDANTGQHLLSYTGHSYQVYALAWSPDGHKLASGSGDHTVHIWDANTGQCFFTYKEHFGFVFAVAWSPDGRRLASGSMDKTVRVWDVITGQTLFSYRGHSETVLAVAWSPDGSKIASSSYDSERTAQVWNSITGQLIFSFDGCSNPMAWSPEGKKLAISSLSHSVQVYNMVSGILLYNYTPYVNGVSVIAWSPDGSRIASSSFGVVRIWQAH
jgi:WD40 repeat protein